MPSLGEPAQLGTNGVEHPAALAASASVGQEPGDALAIVAQNTCPGSTTHTCVARSQAPLIPELPHVNVPVHAVEVAVLVHESESEVVVQPGTDNESVATRRK
jgi:hypothetical protein